MLKFFQRIVFSLIFLSKGNFSKSFAVGNSKSIGWSGLPNTCILVNFGLNLHLSIQHRLYLLVLMNSCNFLACYPASFLYSYSISQTRSSAESKKLFHIFSSVFNNSSKATSLKGGISSKYNSSLFFKKPKLLSSLAIFCWISVLNSSIYLLIFYAFWINFLLKVLIIPRRFLANVTCSFFISSSIIYKGWLCLSSSNARRRSNCKYYPSSFYSYG